VAVRARRLAVPEQADASGLSRVRMTANPQRESQAMTIEIAREARQQAVASIERYFQENMEEKIGNIAASALLGFFLDEIGPLVYNKAVADVQERLGARVAELDIEFHEDEFDYWRKVQKARRGK